jgi:predicted dinucleotide-utilizing enzyme
MTITTAINAVTQTRQALLAALTEQERLEAQHGQDALQVRDYDARVVHPCIAVEVAAEDALTRMQPQTLQDAALKASALLAREELRDGSSEFVRALREDFDRLSGAIAA